LNRRNGFIAAGAIALLVVIVPFLHNGYATGTMVLIAQNAIAALGLGLLFRRDRALAALFALPLLFFPLPYYMTHAEFRYRLNLDPVLVVLAAYAAVEIVAALARRKTPIQQVTSTAASVP